MTGDGNAGNSAWMPPAPSTTAVESLPGYTDLVEVGRGGDSVVYRACELALGRDVAVKVLLVDDEARAARFAREIEITLDLGRQHPNIVTVLATGTTSSGRPAIVMEHHDQGTLHDRRLKELGHRRTPRRSGGGAPRPGRGAGTAATAGLCAVGEQGPSSRGTVGPSG